MVQQPHHALAVGRHGGEQVGEAEPVELGVGGDGEGLGSPGEAECEVGGNGVEAGGEVLAGRGGGGRSGRPAACPTRENRGPGRQTTDLCIPPALSSLW